LLAPSYNMYITPKWYYTSSRAVDHGFKLLSDKTKEYEIGIWCFSAKHAAFRRKSKDWFARNRDNVSE